MVTEEQLTQIEQRLVQRFDLRRSGLSVVDSEDRIICSCLHWGNNFATVTLQNFAEMFANSATDIALLLAEVRRLNRMVDSAIEKLSEFGCVTDADPCPGNYVEVGCAECVRKYLESEVADK